MTLPLEEEALKLLGATEFSREDSNGIAVYANRAGPTLQEARLCFVTNYPSAEEAAREEFLTDFYLAAAKKGTASHPTMDALTRAFVSSRLNPPKLYTQRWREKVAFVLEMSLPAGDAGARSLGQALPLVKDILSTPLVRTPGQGEEILELTRQDSLKTIEDRTNDHGNHARFLFNRRYFPQMEPLDVDAQKALVGGASLADLVAATEGLLAHAFPLLLFSGDASPEQIAAPFASLAAGYSPAGDESALSQMRMLAMPSPGEPVFETGPSEQTQFISAYPLREAPATDRERFSLALVNAVLGGGWSGRLMQVVREKHHLVYGIYSGFDDKRNLVMVRTEHDPRLYGRILGLVQGLVGEVASGDFTDEEFTRQQEQMLESLLVSHGHELASCDQPSFRIDRAYNRFVIGGTDLPLAERYTILAGLSPEDGRDAARRFLDPALNQVFTYAKEVMPDA